MNHVKDFITGAGIGAGLLYFYDPTIGRRRRAQIRDKMAKVTHQTEVKGRRALADASNRIKGMAYSTRNWIERENAEPTSPATLLTTALAGSILWILGRRRGGLLGLILSAAGTGYITRTTTRFVSRIQNEGYGGETEESEETAGSTWQATLHPDPQDLDWGTDRS